MVEVDCLNQAAENSAFRISVQDTGIGIPHGKQPMLFEKFTQADSSTTRKYGGTGLGLAISKRLVELMSGSLTLKSKPGEGSTFLATLRLAIPPAVESAPPEVSSLSALRLLLVTPSELLTRTLSEQMLHWNVRHVTVRNGEEALKLSREASTAGDPFQIILADFRLPDMEGETLARTLKTTPRLSESLFLALITPDRQVDSAQFREAGVDGLLIRPLRPSSLEEIVSQAWKQHSKQKAVFSAPLPPAEPRPQAPEAEPSALTLRILVAEDNVINQTVTVDYLAKPVTRDALRSVLERWCPGVASHAPSAALPSHDGVAQL